MERGYFVNSRHKRLYGAMHVVNPEPQQVWVICNALLEEATFAARPCVELADAIARDGHAAFRFDYEGQGDSQGEVRQLGMADWVDDIASAAAFARARFGADVAVNLLALRAGGLLAAVAVERINGRRLVLVEPVLDGAKYFDDCLRAHMTTQLACFNKVVETRAVLREQLRTGRSVSVLGHDIGQPLSSSIDGLELGQLLSQVRTEIEVDILHVPRHPGRGMPPALTALAQRRPLRLHTCESSTFWDNLGRYWELPNELLVMSRDVVARTTEPLTSASGS